MMSRPVALGDVEVIWNSEHFHIFNEYKMCSHFPRSAPLQPCPSLRELTMSLNCWACKSHRVSYPASLRRGTLSSRTHQILGMTSARTRSTCGQIWKRQTCQFQRRWTALMIRRAPATTTPWARLSSAPSSIFHCRKKALLQELLYSRYTCPPSMGFQPADANEDPLPEASFTCGSDGSWARDPPAAQQGSTELPSCVCECWRHCVPQEQRKNWWKSFFRDSLRQNGTELVPSPRSQPFFVLGRSHSRESGGEHRTHLRQWVQVQFLFSGFLPSFRLSFNVMQTDEQSLWRHCRTGSHYGHLPWWRPVATQHYRWDLALFVHKQWGFEIFFSYHIIIISPVPDFKTISTLCTFFSFSLAMTCPLPPQPPIGGSVVVHNSGIYFSSECLGSNGYEEPLPARCETFPDPSGQAWYI